MKQKQLKAAVIAVILAAGNGQWATSLKYKNGRYDVFFASNYLFSTFDQNAMTSSNDIDKANFYYSYGGTNWTKIGSELSMKYKLTLFTGYRTAIFTYATKQSGGYVDVDWFHYEKTPYQPALQSQSKTGGAIGAPSAF